MWRVPTKKQVDMFNKWVAEGGPEKLLSFEFLTPDSWVWEIGGYKGDWVKKMAERYDCWITAFEPVAGWYVAMHRMFSDNPKIRIENYGLGNRDRWQDIGLSEDGTSIFCPTNLADVQIKSIKKVMGECKVDNIDLMKCNCEGGEYEIFPQLIKTKLIKRFKTVIIQFHNLHESHPGLRSKIQKGLEKTHHQTSCYDWRFEFWERNDA